MIRDYEIIRVHKPSRCRLFTEPSPPIDHVGTVIVEGDGRNFRLIGSTGRQICTNYMVDRAEAPEYLLVERLV